MINRPVILTLIPGKMHTLKQLTGAYLEITRRQVMANMDLSKNKPDFADVEEGVL